MAREPTGWTPEQLERIGASTELQLASRRADDTLRPYVTMWVVGVGEDLYVRSAYGPDNRWYRRATTPTEDLLEVPILGPGQVTDTLHAYQLAKRANSLRVMAEAVRWARRGARVNTISPGIIITPLARDELTGPRGEGYRQMVERSPVGRAGTPDEVATLAALLMGHDGAFITGSDILIDGGVTASYFYGDLAPQAITL